MCGIVGATGPRSESTTTALLAEIGHRGPDGRGLWTAETREGSGVAFGHARLAILDPTERSSQPFTRGHRTLIYNGEIYNHVELRNEMEARGTRFSSAGDTEVVLAVIEEFGFAGLDRLEGMFAFALWDAADHSLHLGRDRHGIKPLYWRGERGGGISFSSELTPLATASTSDVDPDAIREFLRFGSPISKAISTQINEVAPGTVMRVTQSGLDVSTFALQRREMSTPVDTIRLTIGQHARSDRSVALFLSGGFDSAVILSGLASAGRTPLCLTLATEHNHEEVERARAAAANYGARHEVVAIDESRLEASIDGFLRAMDQPTVDGFNTYLISEVCRSFDCPVALSGLGGDEVLGGYRYYRTEDRLRSLEPWIRRTPERLRGVAARVASRAMQRSSARLTELMAAEGTAGRHRAFRALFSDEEIIGLTAQRPPQSIRWDVDPDLDGRRQLARLDAMTYLQPTLLRDSDVFAMWHGIELRVPFVDTRVHASVLAHGEPPTKLELAQAWDDPFLVEKATEPKLTFRLPWERWLSTIEASSEDILDRQDPWHGLVDVDAARKILADGADDSAEPLRRWSLLVLARWLALRSEPRLSPTADVSLSIPGTEAPEGVTA